MVRQYLDVKSLHAYACSYSASPERALAPAVPHFYIHPFALIFKVCGFPCLLKIALEVAASPESRFIPCEHYSTTASKSAMTLQATTGYGSLIAIGLGVGDVATIYSLGRRFGNWWTAASGDDDLLRTLDEDEMNILRRRGLIDLPRFNATWNNSMTLLANGSKLTIEGEHAQKVLGHLSRFTASMICIIASVDTFAASSVTRVIFKSLLLKLLQTTEHGEDIVLSELSNRLNAWRSAACVRGIHKRAQEIRLSLLRSEQVMSGTLPAAEAREVVEFLYWLLTGDTDAFHTSSSDLAGIAWCLSNTGFDLLSVHGFSGNCAMTACRLFYNGISNVALIRSSGLDVDPFSAGSRGLCTTVSLIRPEECMSLFPVSKGTAHRCRYAWKSGGIAAQAVQLHVISRPTDEISYAAVDLGDVYDRVEEEVFMLISACGFVINKELCDAFQGLLQDYPPNTARNIYDQIAPQLSDDPSAPLNKPFKGDTEQIEAFTVVQAFWMGYYYAVCLRLVDTSSLQLQLVEGAWGFRSTQFLADMRSQGAKMASPKHGIRRHAMLELLSAMLCAKRVTAKPTGRGRDCVGITARRTLLCNSLVRVCSSPDSIGQFVLLDIDVGGVPSDFNGLLRPGLAQRPVPASLDKPTLSTLQETGPKEDCTRHIEADWDVDPETVLLCIRYKGRRLASLNVAEADTAFSGQYVKPAKDAKRPQDVEGTLKNVGIDDLLADQLPDPYDHPILVQSYNAPTLAYAFTAIYRFYPLKIASNCISTAWDVATEERRELNRIGLDKSLRFVVISRPTSQVTIPYEVVEPESEEEVMQPFKGMLKEIGAWPEGAGKTLSFLKSEVP